MSDIAYWACPCCGCMTVKQPGHDTVEDINEAVCEKCGYPVVDEDEELVPMPTLQ